MVSAQDFRDAFSQQWRADRRRKSAKLRDAYQDDKRWTAYMLGKKDDFLGTFFDRLARRLGQEMLRERQNLDVVSPSKQRMIFCGSHHRSDRKNQREADRRGILEPRASCCKRRWYGTRNHHRLGRGRDWGRSVAADRMGFAADGQSLGGAHVEL